MQGSARLGINIDHVATLRNARGENYPSPSRAALMCEKFGADGITAHLREDRRHIRDSDIGEILNEINIPFNFEMAPTDEMVEIAINYKPNACCLVPEKREEVTTEGGLDLVSNFKNLEKKIKIIKDCGIKVSLFIDAVGDQIKAASDLGSDIIEIHTGKYCRLVNENINSDEEYLHITESCFDANQIGLEVHAGHGITFKSISHLAKIEQIKEFNIGHFIVGESVFHGLEDVIKKFKSLINEA